MKTRNTFSVVTLVTASIFVTACGGGSSTTSPTGISTSKITGTVPGTLIEAFCTDGSYAQVSSVQNGTTQHPFEISIPSNTQCRLVMTTNENNASNRIITPIGFIKSSTTGQTLTLSNDIDLGNIPLELTYADVADGNNDHVVDSPLNVEINSSNTVSTLTTANISAYDKDDDGDIDVYQDKDSNGLVDAYDDDNNNGTLNIHEDSNNDNRPDYLEDDDKDGTLNYRDDDDNNNRPDYLDDDDNDGLENHVDNDDNGDGIDDDD